MEPRIALSYYSLPVDYLETLEQKAGGHIRNLVISSLKGVGTLDIVTQLARLEVDTIYVPTPDRDWTAFTPLLRLIAQIARPRQVILVDDKLVFRQDPPWTVLPLLLGVILRTAAALALTMMQYWQLKLLLAKERQDCGLDADKRHVLYIKSNLWAGITAGGSISHTAGVIKALSNIGRSVLYISPGAAPELSSIKDATANRLSIHGGFVYPRELNSLRYNRALTQWAAKLPKRRFGFIYHRLSLGSFAAVTAARRLGIPLVVEYNGSEVWINRNWGTRLKLEGLAVMAEDAVLRHAHLVVAVSAPLRRELIARGVEAERIVAHPNGFDETRFDPRQFGPEQVARVRDSLKIAPDAVVATFVGTFGMWHGADILAHALVHLGHHHMEWLDSSRLHVVFVGDGVNRTNVENILAGQGLEGRYTFTGLVQPHETPQYLAASDFFVAPHVPNPDGSEFFGSPTKLFEYMGMAKPVLASNLAQIGEVMAGAPRLRDCRNWDEAAEPDQCGVLVEPANIGALADGLVYLTDHPNWRQSAGINARRRALERYTWGHHVGAILAGLGSRLAPAPALPGGIVCRRILVNAVHSKSGGGLTYLRNVIPLLATRAGFDIHVVVQSDQAESASPICADAGVTIHLLPTWSRLGTVLLQEQVSIPLLARRIHADVVFSPANYGPVMASRSVILLRNAFEVTALEQRRAKQLYWLGVKLLTRLCFATCRRAIIVSKHASNTFLDVFGLDSDPRIDVVHHGVGIGFHPPADDGARSPGRLLAVSDIYVQKNFETLLRAVALLAPDHRDLRLDIAGNELDPTYAERLKALCRELGIEGRVAFLGGQPPAKVAELYRQAQVFVFPSLVETFGNPLVEAMASGIPVVCSDSAAMPEVTGGAALLARPRDVEHMAAQIRRLLDDSTLWAEMSARGLERARDFSWERTADLTADILREAAED
ncbi:hypothetical protein CU669_11285 [Paramagnetospirillum kuznetsovii]|uniref:Glycosyltransferase n=1 Tax=Paramagnetospirillum kuznetsovii TaxID=2053833 RepID=A0A364NY90_9PROT|nr:glycosyltransferase [Paramagnetospirillum kuznetsovii]RAU21877.1 hypothetical protein CU669_11285 [Paramagnetospirillum kuznetsovii]